MVVVVPDEIDFSGALDGLVSNRQPQIRYKHKNWWFALENPETTINPFESEAVQVTDSEILPDVVIRRNFNDKRGTWGVAAMIRTLHARDTSNRQSAIGFGLTTGGKLLVGKKGDDLRMMFTGGMGLGRYLSANFIAGATIDQERELNPIPSLNGYIVYNHFWMPKTLSSSFSVAAFQAFSDQSVSVLSVNNNAYSKSGNFK